MATIPPEKMQRSIEVTKDLTATLGNWFQERAQEAQKDGELDPVTFERLSVVALIRYASVLGVDAGMNEDQFVKMCAYSFKEAYAVAPKWA